MERFLLDAKRQIFRMSNLFLLSLFVLQTAVLVLQKIISLHAGNYPYVLTVTQPIFTTFSFGALYFIAKLYKYCTKDRKDVLSAKHIQQHSVPPSPAVHADDPETTPLSPQRPLLAPRADALPGYVIISKCIFLLLFPLIHPYIQDELRRFCIDFSLFLLSSSSFCAYYCDT